MRLEEAAERLAERLEREEGALLGVGRLLAPLLLLDDEVLGAETQNEVALSVGDDDVEREFTGFLGPQTPGLFEMTRVG